MTDVSGAKTWCRNDCEYDYDNGFDCDYDHGCAHDDDDVPLVMCCSTTCDRMISQKIDLQKPCFMFDPRHCINP